MQEKKENLTMGNSGHTAMSEDAMPTIEQKDAVQAFDPQKQMEDLLNADDVVCAHVYDSNGYSEFLFRGFHTGAVESAHRTVYGHISPGAGGDGG